MSADGKTALVGAPNDNNGRGSAWVFIRTGSTWVQQGSKLVGAGQARDDRFGSSVALSANGSTALIGGIYSGRHGAAWVFIRKGSTWLQQGSKLTGRGGTAHDDQFGISVALSGDGNTALVGGNGTDPSIGAAWVFVRKGQRWMQQGKKLTVMENSRNPAGFGVDVALSRDGESALIGGLNDAGGQYGSGAVWTFHRKGSNWALEGKKLTAPGPWSPSGGPNVVEFGSSIALSADGSYAVVCGHFIDPNIGAAWAFRREGSSWVQQGRLTAVGVTTEEAFCGSAALSAGGEIALIDGDGPIWTFVRSASAWQKGVELQASGPFKGGGQVALSSDGRTALVGGPDDNGGVGVVLAFHRG